VLAGVLWMWGWSTWIYRVEAWGGSWWTLDGSIAGSGQRALSPWGARETQPVFQTDAQYF